MRSTDVTDHICLIEDDTSIRELVEKKLKAHGYAVTATDDMKDALPKSKPFFDIYIVDLLIHGSLKGLDLVKELRKQSLTLPILILSARSEPSDRIEGLRSGADDYLTKPFEMEELLLRVKGMLTRRLWYKHFPSNRSTFQWDGNTVDFAQFVGNTGHGEFPISQKECMLLKLLIEREGEVVTRDEILDRVWGYNVFPSSRTVDNFVLRLRKYFEDEPSNPKYIQSVRGVGYRFSSRGIPDKEKL